MYLELVVNGSKLVGDLLIIYVVKLIVIKCITLNINKMKCEICMPLTDGQWGAIDNMCLPMSNSNYMIIYGND